jgi:hypothetical protein
MTDLYLAERLRLIANSIERTSMALGDGERPGHVAYITKSDAATRLASDVLNLRKEVHDIEAIELREWLDRWIANT